MQEKIIVDAVSETTYRRGVQSIRDLGLIDISIEPLMMKKKMNIIGNVYFSTGSYKLSQNFTHQQ